MDQSKLEEFLGTFMNDMGGAMSTAMAWIGDQLGLYKAMARYGPMTSENLAKATDTNERYIRDWLNNQASAGYVQYHPDDGTYELPEEQALVFANPESPAFMGDGYLGFIPAMWAAEGRMLESFRTGRGIGWHEHDERLYRSTEQFFRPGYRDNLTATWIPALEDVQERLEAGARVADIGCGYGASAIVMAEAYPNSHIVGFDYHEGSIETAAARAAEAGVDDRVEFRTATAKDFDGGPYDLICYFDCLHDLGDPVGAVGHALTQLKGEGSVLLVEPFAHDNPEDNHNPIGKLFYAASVFLCTANSLSQEVGAALGSQAGETRLREVFEEAGFTRFHRATETPFNLILQARP